MTRIDKRFQLPNAPGTVEQSLQQLTQSCWSIYICADAFVSYEPNVRGTFQRCDKVDVQSMQTLQIITGSIAYDDIQRFKSNRATLPVSYQNNLTSFPSQHLGKLLCNFATGLLFLEQYY